MDPVSGAASIITLAILAKDIAHTSRRCIQNFRNAPAILARFCDELEVLTVLFDQILAFHQTDRLQSRPSRHFGVLSEVLRRTDLLKDYERQLKILDNRLKRLDFRHVTRRLLFPLQERQILDGLNVVQRTQSLLESALRLDDRLFFIRDLRSN